MRFRVTTHTAVKPPGDALDLLEARIPPRREDIVFSRAGCEIQAFVDRDDAIRMTHDERVELGREAVLGVLGDVCECAPELRFDWFAVSPAA